MLQQLLGSLSFFRHPSKHTRCEVEKCLLLFSSELSDGSFQRPLHINQILTVDLTYSSFSLEPQEESGLCWTRGLTIIVKEWTSPVLIHVEVPLTLRVDKRLLQSVFSQKLLSGNQSFGWIA